MGKNASIIYGLSDSEFVDLFRQCHSYSEVLRKLGLSSSGGASRTVLLNRLQQLDLTRDDLCKEPVHRPSPNALKDDDIFQVGRFITGHVLKTHYLKVRKEPYMCDICGITDWNNAPLVLHLDHINGRKNDNRLQNLRLLCPNCDSQMATYRGRNIKISSTQKQYHRCALCYKSISAKAVYCKQCSNKINAVRNRQFVIDREELKDQIRHTSFVAIGARYGVSDNAIRKRCKAFGLPYRSCDIKQYSDEDWKSL